MHSSRAIDRGIRIAPGPLRTRRTFRKQQGDRHRGVSAIQAAPGLGARLLPLLLSNKSDGYIYVLRGRIISGSVSLYTHKTLELYSARSYFF